VDHDFLRGENRERPFTPPPEQSLLRWLIALLILLALAYAGNRIFQQLSHDPPAAVIKPAAVARSPATAQAPLQIPSPSITEPKAGSPVVTKCLSNGRTTYSDGSCPAGAKTSQVITKENLNLMDSIRIPMAPPATELPVKSAAITQSKPNPDYAAMKAECAAWDERIKYLDAMARQPLDGTTQDWIRGERKNARDRQARIPCR